jgi:hypothetical protein
VKKLLVVLALLVAATAYAATYTNEVLVLTTATRVDTGPSWRTAIEIQNQGPNAIYCAIEESSAAVVSKARKLASGEAWSLVLPWRQKVYCITSVNQVTLGATVVTEVQ